MDNDLRASLNKALEDLRGFTKSHTVGNVAGTAEVSMIEDAADHLAEASERIQNIDDLYIEGRKSKNIELELEKRSEELMAASNLMSQYDTRESDDTEMPTAYDNVILTIEWIENFI